MFNKAQKMRSMIRAQTLEMLESVDVMLMPTSPAPPQVMDLTAGINTEREAASWLSDASFRGLFSMVSGPALSICSGVHHRGWRRAAPGNANRWKALRRGDPLESGTHLRAGD